MTDAESVVTVPKFLPTGLPNIDDMLGGGIPAGRITELFSKGEGQGKSSLAARLMAEMQARGGTVMLMDTEHGFTEERLRTFGVDPDKIVWVEPNHIESACKTISKTLRYLKKNPEKGDKVLIVWDSVTATPAKQEYEADYGEIQVASAARAWSVNLKKLKDEIAKSEAYVIMINQTRTNIGVMFGEKQTSTGGMAIRYYAGCRLVLYRGKGAWLKAGTERKGFLVTMEMEKSRLNAPFQKALVPLVFETGWDRWKSLFDLLLKLGIITQHGAYYELEGVDKKFQQKAFPKSFQSLDKAAREALIEKLEARYIDRDSIEVFFE
jgi:recombination protein RecA